jgi:hypothetical protein
MNRIARIAAAALSLAAAGTAFADSPNAMDPLPSVSTLSRAEVKAQVLQARANGTLRTSEADLNKSDVVASSRTRADVRAETLAAIAQGDILGGGELGTVVAHAARPAAAVQLARLSR